jgi:hypothetical protein
MAIMRVKARWTIPGAGTAYSILHFGALTDGNPTDTDAGNVATATRTFFDQIKALLPGVVKIDVMQEVEVLDASSGNMTGIVTAGTQLQVVGGAGATATWSAPSGACITWSTAGIRNNRRVRGRTFLVPLATMAYAPDGTIDSTPLSTLNTAAQALRGNFSGQNLGVYARPPKGTQSGGQFYSVSGHRITDQAAILRSRRS